ncbi:DUF998 domain-containing protein [Streptosporangium sp. 'caverna']|uniref:DUF998 domain-containing protein n=1 Tax=Streptosporangium sp. 'caverna' TaxID=2202249 RepID=UPI000D7E542C|nr:DUF998 domain-containing protein [Streptosporangium sp. 'caverna']AWS41266.1 hypothetical protein DKM19_07730 [Streptosporangium sp. 'caverna']
MNGTPLSRWPGMAGAAFALAAMAYAHVAAADTVNPASGLISDYALVGTSAWALVGGTIMLAMGSLWTAFGLARVDPARSAAARVLLLAAALGLLLTAGFPTDSAPDVVSIGGEIHRWSAAVVFTALPCAGWMLGRRSSDRALSAVSALSVVFLAAFLAAHPGSLTADLIDGSEYYGLIERLLVLTEIVLIFLAARGVGGWNRASVVPAPRDADDRKRESALPLTHRSPGADRLGARATVPAQPSADDARRPREPVGLHST